jgi:hypothetical protein
MQTRFPPERDSIFGDTYDGVPNPNVPHVHPWPTRFHGPNYTVPGVANPTYVERPYAKVPYVGFGAAPLFEHITGGGFSDAVLGAGVGYVAAPLAKDRLAWVVAGALGGFVAGLAGVVATSVAGILLRK